MSWILGVFLAAVFLLATAGNLGIVLNWLAKGKHGTFVPLVGGLVGCAACYALPLPHLARWSWLPFVLDLGSAYLFIALIVFVLRRVFSGRATPSLPDTKR